MPRLIVAPPMARSAVWARRFGASGAFLATAAVILSHHETIGPLHALALLGCGLGLAGLAIACVLGASVDIWRHGSRGAGRALVGLGLAIGTAAYPSILAGQSWQKPSATDVVTDAVDPPRFSISIRALSARGGFDRLGGLVGTGEPRHRAEQPPVFVDADGADAYAEVLKTLKLLRWRVIDAVAPGGRSGFGHIDAVTHSAVLHLPQDLAIRIRPLAGQTRIDVRAMSRLPLPDSGDEVRLVETLADALRDQDDDR